MTKTAVVLAGGVPQIELIRKLKRRGYRNVLVDYTKHPVAESHADRFYRESTLDVDAVRRIVRLEAADLVITCCTDQALATVSLVSEEMGLPCYLDANTGQNVTDKARMKKMFLAGGIPTAPFEFVREGCMPALRDYPLVVKPCDCNSSKGVMKVSDDDELADAIREAIDLSRSRRAIVERFVDGIEISADFYIVDGAVKLLCLSRSDKIDGIKGFVICRGIYIPALMRELSDAALEIGRRIAVSFGLAEGPMLVQMLWDGTELNVIEFSARTGGCVKYEMIGEVSGVDVIECTLMTTLGESPVVLPSISEKIVADEFVYASPGVFDHVEGVEECAARGLIKKWHLLHTQGTGFSGVSNSGDRVMAMTITASSEEEYVEKYKEVAASIDIVDSSGESMIRRDLMRLQ